MVLHAKPLEGHLIATCLDEIATHDEHLGDRDSDAAHDQAGIIIQKFKTFGFNSICSNRTSHRKQKLTAQAA